MINHQEMIKCIPHYTPLVCSTTGCAGPGYTLSYIDFGYLSNIFKRKLLFFTDEKKYCVLYGYVFVMLSAYNRRVFVGATQYNHDLFVSSYAMQMSLYSSDLLRNKFTRQIDVK